MKKILLSIIYLLACLLSIQAQTLFGTTFKGGTEGGGTISKFIPATYDLTVAKSLEGVEADPFFANFIQASDGKLYGMTTHGGRSDSGAIFSFDPFSSTYTKLKDFDYTTGTEPYGSLIQANDGRLYGTTTGGGSSGGGVIFSYDPSNSTYSRLKDLNYDDGALSYGSLIQASDGKLYGTTASGGTNFAGVIFSFDLSTSTYTKLKDFDMTIGAGPYGNLIQASDGKLYGITAQGGSNGYGVIYSFDPSNSILTNLKDFDLTNGGYTNNGSLIQASDGKLYGMSYRGGSSDAGVIFSFDPSTSIYTNLKEFDITNGAYPYGSLIQAIDGKLYGMTNAGGSSDVGVIFSFDPLASTYTKLTDFNNTNGTNPFGSLVQASDGKFYAMTHAGGNGNRGVIFSLDPSNSTFTKLKDFGTNETGNYVPAGLLQAGDGRLYGMTYSGGASGVGVIFSLDHSTSTFTNLKDFDNANGSNPNGSLIQASDGKLYGMTTYGGSSNNGVIFSFDPSASTYTKLKDFDYIDGSNPNSSLIQASDGKLYGTTAGGGSNFSGVLFPFLIHYLPLIQICGILTMPPELPPYSNLIQASDGKLYGTLPNGGTNNAGGIFSFDPLSSTYTNLKDLDYLNGGYPYGNLIQASDGKLYGMTSGGGINGFGVIYSFDPLTSIYADLKDFDNTNGGYPYGGLLQASDGKLYGTTYQGGSNDAGVIFTFDPSGNTYTKLKDFVGSNGANPYNASLIEINECISKTYYRDADRDSYGNPDSSIMACSKPAGYVENNMDCDDHHKAVHGPVTWYQDTDHDGFGNPEISVKACARPEGYVKNNFDCNDNKRADRRWNERIRMCHNGMEECVRLKDIFKKLWHGWTLGPCPAACDNRPSKIIAGDIVNKEKNSKLQLLPLEYKISNYPNPFAGSSTIKYELPQDSRVSIKVYDLMGRAVATLVDEFKKAGIYTVNFNAGRLSSGSLYYRIIAKSKDDQFEQTNQMIKIK